MPADGAFDVDLRAWGGMKVTTKSTFSGSNDVMVSATARAWQRACQIPQVTAVFA